MTNAVLVNDYTGTNVHFKEYNVNWSETYSLIPGDQILVGYDYDSEIVYLGVIAPNSTTLSTVAIGTMPMQYFNTNDNFRLIITFESPTANNLIIPYEIDFKFSQGTTIPPFYTNTPTILNNINPFIPVLDRPIVNITSINSSIRAGEYLSLTYTSNATDSVSIDIYDNNMLWVGGDSGLPTSGPYTSTFSLPQGNYTVCAVAYNEPVIYGTACESLEVTIAALPTITGYIVEVDKNTINLTYTSTNSVYVDISTTFGQNSTNNAVNGVIQYSGLNNNTQYIITLYAYNIENSVSSYTIEFELNIPTTVNNTKGVLGKKYF